MLHMFLISCPKNKIAPFGLKFVKHRLETSGKNVYINSYHQGVTLFYVDKWMSDLFYPLSVFICM